MERLAHEMAARGAHAARTVVLLPYAQLMPVAQQFWAARAPTGFAPRFQTTMNWSRLAGFLPSALDLSFDMARDLLAARAWLEQGGMRAQADLLASRLVEAAWEAAAAARAIPPAQRAAWAASLRPALVQGFDAPVLATEAAIARIAFEWAAASGYASDALLDGTLTADVDLLVVLEGFQAEPVVRTLVSQLQGRAALWPLALEGDCGQLALHTASDAADEAERAAACVLRRVEAGRLPVALAATDRLLTRRVVALLASRGVAVRDETGWKLSTTRAAAGLMGALRACAWDASTDAVIGWLKSAPALGSGLVQGLERRARRSGQREWRMLRTHDWGESEALRAAAERVNGWREQMQPARSLLQWLAAWRSLVESSGQWAALAQDAAGLRAIEALGLELGAEEGLDALPHGQRRVDLRGFTAWASEVLEAVGFVPTRSGGEPVVAMPLSQLLAHPFGALVVPGCDERNLPAAPDPSGAWTAAQRRALGLPDRAELEAAQRGAWRQALQTPEVDILWRTSDDSGEPILPSPLVQALRLQSPTADAADPRAQRVLRAQGVSQPAPAAQQLLPAQLSASSYEDLRRCPYRFFALRMLGLKEADELETEVDKRDFGVWLHHVLRAFHEAMRDAAPVDGEQRLALLERLGQEAMAALRLGEGEFLPFAAAWPAVRDGYLQWLAQHEAAGAVFVEAEGDHQRQLGSLALQGRIDRVDRLAGGGLLVMDYKTEGLPATQERMRAPLEDTQLAFYAALLGQDRLRAAYLNIGERGKVKAVEHPDVLYASHLLQEGMQAELRRIAQGAPLPALGEGRACEYCAARGLCRKDAWE